MGELIFKKKTSTAFLSKRSSSGVQGGNVARAPIVIKQRLNPKPENEPVKVFQTH